MNGLLKYRVVAFALALIFSVFNIGIPIIIASCPMAAMMQGGTCGMCSDQDDAGISKVTTERNASCCATRIAAERNTNEFVQVTTDAADATKLLSIVLTPSVSGTALQYRASIPSQATSSPPTVVDIPILVSSLLI